MATKAAPKKKLPQSKKKNQTVVGRVGVSNNSIFKNKFLAILVIGLIATFGTYYLINGSAASKSGHHIDDPSRGLSYKALNYAEDGPCKEQFKLDAVDERGEACTHPDPSPEGIDARDRDKQVETMIAKQVEHDTKNPAKNAGEPTPPPLTEYDNTTGANSLNQVSPVNWPCVGTGNDGYRTLVIYAYQSGATNRQGSLRPYIEGVARRTNAIYYNSGVESGGSRQVRFQTSSSCVLSIPSAAISGDISSFSNVQTQLRNIGYTSTARKYLVLVDGGTPCGLGSSYQDARATQDNYNNSGNMYAMVWHPCWNYAEPQELTHTMGAVQNGAPYATGAGHCYDQNDVMCYTDTSGKTMVAYCTSSTSIWRLDCRKDTYFRSAGATGWLASNWNVANSRFLAR